MRSYFATGKILLAGEYAVLTGVEALALPVKAGQWLKVWEAPTQGLSKFIWEAREVNGSSWFHCRIDTDIMHITESSDEDVAHKLLHLLQVIQELKPEFFTHKTFRIETDCQFDRNWGLGTSSTLVKLLSDWSQTDGFLLQKRVFGGSGYDIAVAVTGKPLIYRLENEQPSWEPWTLDPALTEDWYLVFPGYKQDSRVSVKSLSDKLDQLKSDKMLQSQLDMMVQGIRKPVSKMMLEASLEMWQGMLAQILDLPRTYDDLGITPVKGGICKWLGAWGGDILLVNKTMLDAYPAIFTDMHQHKWNDFVISS